MTSGEHSGSRTPPVEEAGGGCYIRPHILTLPLKIKVALNLGIDAQEKITVHVHDVLTDLAKGCFTIREAVAYQEKPFNELTSDELLAMSYAMMSNRTYMSDEDKRRVIDEMIVEAERDACAATPIPFRRNDNDARGQS